MPDDLDDVALLEVSLKALRLRPGLFLSLQSVREGAAVHDAIYRGH